MNKFHKNLNVQTAAIADETDTNGKKTMKKRMKSLFPTGIITKIAYLGNKLSTCFRVKDVIEFKQNLPSKMSRNWL